MRSRWGEMRYGLAGEVVPPKKKVTLGRVRGEHLRLIDTLGEYQSFRTSSAQYSFWLQRFFNTFTLGGGKARSYRLLSTALWGLSQLVHEDPIMLVFEMLELYRYPFMAIQVQRGWASIVRLTALAWWRQYLVVLRWFARSTYITVAGHSATISMFRELVCLFTEPAQSRTVMRRSQMVLLSTQSRLALSYRWK